MYKVCTVATNQQEGLDRLKESCIANGIDLEVIGMGHPWKGFGTKIILLREYLQRLKGYTHFIFVDAYDVLFLDELQLIKDKYELLFDTNQLLFSAEKNCWPDPNLKDKYPSLPGQWRYLNSGSYMGSIETFLRLTEIHPVKWENDDQLYFTNIFLDEIYQSKNFEHYSPAIWLDIRCEIFQSIAFSGEGDFDIKDSQLWNLDFETRPLIIHGNGKTDMDHIYNLIKQ